MFLITFHRQISRLEEGPVRCMDLEPPRRLSLTAGIRKTGSKRNATFPVPSSLKNMDLQVLGPGLHRRRGLRVPI